MENDRETEPQRLTNRTQQEYVGSHEATCSLYEQLISPAKAFPGVTPQFKPGKFETIAVEYYRLTRDLLEVPHLTRSVAAHCYQVLGFIRRFANIEKTQLPENKLGFLIIDLADYCDGLPSCLRIVETFTRVYEESSSVRIKIASAECVGRFRAGLPQAKPMFLQLMSVNGPTTKVIGAMVRTLAVQSRLASQAAERRQEFQDLYVETTRELREFRDELCEFAASDAHGTRFKDSGLVSVLDSTVFQLRRDEHFFRSQMDALLQEHRNEFVAIRDGKILGFAKSRRAIEQLVDVIAGAGARAFVEQVTPNAFKSKDPVTIFTG